MAVRRILVTGATGKQGGAVIDAILKNPPPFSHEILALTRNTSSPAAQALSKKSHVTVVQGDLDDCAAVFKKIGIDKKVWGVFSVQVPAAFNGKGPRDIEQKQGFALVDAAVANGVSHFVYSSVGNGGPGTKSREPHVPHFESKWDIEDYLKTKAASSNMTWTILQPVAFMENATPDQLGKGFAAMWNNMGTTKLQLVATKDIGVFAALAFADAEKFQGKEIILVGDDLTQVEGNDIFFDLYGRSLPRSYGFVGSLIQWMIAELGIMFKWFMVVGYKGDIAECKKYHPEMLDFRTWLKQESEFKDWVKW